MHAFPGEVDTVSSGGERMHAISCLHLWIILKRGQSERFSCRERHQSFLHCSLFSVEIFSRAKVSQPLSLHAALMCKLTVHWTVDHTAFSIWSLPVSITEESMGDLVMCSDVMCMTIRLSSNRMCQIEIRLQHNSCASCNLQLLAWSDLLPQESYVG